MWLRAADRASVTAPAARHCRKLGCSFRGINAARISSSTECNPGAAVTGPRSLEYRNQGLVAPTLRMLKRCYAVAISDRLIGTRSDQSFCRGDVALATIAEHNSLYERGPTKVVDMIEWRTGFDQCLHHRIVAQMRGGDQGGSVISAGNCSRIAAEFDGKLYHADIVVDGGDCEHIIAIILKGIDV